jgi:colanic acid/amylovoran biosynthesis protein
MGLPAKNPDQQVLTVGLLWHSTNSDNLGVTALTASNIVIVEEAARSVGRAVRFVILSWRDSGHQQIAGDNIEIFSMRARDLLQPNGLFAKARGCDLVLDISAGDSFADIYGVRRFAFNMISKMIIGLASRDLIFSPQTIGPFTRKWAEIAARKIMNRAAVVVTRDRLSTSYVRSLGVKNIVEATDVAFVLPYTTASREPGNLIKIGLNISGLLFNGGYSRANMFNLKSDYQLLARTLVARLISMPSCEIHLVSHVISDRFETEDDYRVAQLLASEFPGAIVAPKFRTSSEAKSYIANLDFFSGSRMHACIAAFSSGVPVVPMAYSRKFSGLFGTLGYDTIADCKILDTDEVIEKVIHGFVNRDVLKEQVEKGRRAATEKLANYSELLRDRFQKVQPGKRRG